MPLFIYYNKVDHRPNFVEYSYPSLEQKSLVFSGVAKRLLLYLANALLPPTSDVATTTTPPKFSAVERRGRESESTSEEKEKSDRPGKPSPPNLVLDINQSLTSGTINQGKSWNELVHAPP